MTSPQISTEAWSDSALAEFVRLASEVGASAAKSEPLSRHTSFGVGGPCPVMVSPRTADQTVELLSWTGSRGLRVRSLGGGTNLLVNDDGIDEPVLDTTRLTEGTRLDESSATLPAGLPTARALHSTANAGFDGLVWAAGLPGTIGGAAAGNAGCWGGDMAGSTEALDVVGADGAARRLDSAELSWAYRSLSLPADIARPYTIVTVTVALQTGDADALRARYEDLQERKRDTQPVGARNSGCIFRNPDSQPAGAILDAAGCKGLRVGGARVSDRHANFIVNDGNATASDILALIDELVARAHAATGIELLPEVRKW